MKRCKTLETRQGGKEGGEVGGTKERAWNLKERERQREGERDSEEGRGRGECQGGRRELELFSPPHILGGP
jgi:hypothetical protein